MLGSQAPYFYRFKLGTAEATMVSDGSMPLGDPHKNFNGLSAAEMDKQLTDNFLPLENAVLEQNVLVLNTGDRMALFDTGMGSLKIFRTDDGQADDDVEAGRDRSERHRRRRDEPCSYRPLRRLHRR